MPAGRQAGTTDECDALVPDSTAQPVTNPFVGVCLVHRTTTTPRPLAYRVALIHPRAPGIRFTVTPHNVPPPRHHPANTPSSSTKGPVAVNANFFAPFPPVDPYADVRGLAASEGTVYGRFSEAYYAGLNIDEGGEVRVVHPAKDAPDGTKTAENAVLHNAVGTREQILADGAPMAVSTGASGENHPRTAAGVTRDGRLVLLVVDGRQAAISEGVTTSELASILATDFAVVDAINLDGGGSTSLAIADPIPRLDHVPSGLAEEREVGNSLAVFATPRSAESTGDLIAYEPFSYARRPWGGSAWPIGGGLDDLLGGSGFASAWHDDHTHERASGIAVYPGDARDDPEDRRQAALAYTDGSGKKLRTSGNQMRTSLGRSSRVWRALGLARVAQRDRTPTGQPARPTRRCGSASSRSPTTRQRRSLVVRRARGHLAHRAPRR